MSKDIIIDDILGCPFCGGNDLTVQRGTEIGWKVTERTYGKYKRQKTSETSH
jgi:hypothetical protein